MPTIADAIASLEADRSAFAAALATANAQGSQSDAVAAQTRAAQAEADSAIGRAMTEKALAEAGNARLATALSARQPALAALTAAKGSGGLLANATATALMGTVVAANGGDQAKFDAAVGNVRALDLEIDTLGDTEHGELTAALDTLAAKQVILAQKKEAALALLAAAERASGDIASQLAAAKDASAQAAALAAASGDPAHRSAIVAYADYSALRDALGATKTDAALTSEWQAARDEWLTAAVDVTTAEEAVIEKRLAWQGKLAEQTARKATRAAAAAAKAGEAF